VLIYIDDIIITSSHPAAISQLINDLHSSFALKDLGPLYFFLGVEATWHLDGLHLSQQIYIHDNLTKTNIVLVKPVFTPMAASTTLNRFKGSIITDTTLYPALSILYNIYLLPVLIYCICGQQILQIYARPPGHS
jgi:hypothetical protein